MSSLEFKPDWDQAREKLRAWWHGRGLALSVFAPRTKALFGLPKPEIPVDAEERWLDAEFRINNAEYLFDNTFYGGTAFPDANLYLGPGCMALYIGCKGDFSKCDGTFSGQDTIWFFPFITDPGNAPDLIFDRENKYWQRHLEMIMVALERGADRYRVSIPVFVNNLDMLGYTRGATELLLDLVDRPEWVHRCQRQILDLYFLYYQEVYELVKDPDGACSYNGFQAWAPGKVTRAGVDFGAMISPKMYREFVIPYVQEECDRVDYAIFHLDGPECICHVDELLKIRSLHAFQWSPKEYGCGSPHWFPLYEKIRSAGRSLQLRGVEEDELAPLLSVLGHDGLNIWMNVSSEAAANRILDKYA